MKNIMKAVSFLLSVLLVSSTQSILNAQSNDTKVKIFDEKGNYTGLLNVNPDPFGDPWIINEGGLKPMSAEEQAAWDALPYFTVAPELRGRSLPKTVDHSTSTYFRPIFNQIGGSCGQASGTGYHFTFERNQLLNLPGSDKNNICAYGFTWNFVNGGNGTGSWPYQGYEIEKTMGAGHVPDFNNADNGGSQTAWMDGYDGYYKGNDVHVTEVVKFSNTIDITAMKNWFYDKGTGTGKGGSPITFCASVNYVYGTVASGPFAGQKLITNLPDGTAHAMTWAGYSDEVSYDINKDGKISNDIDITRDGKVDISDFEQGAVQLVNSWGPSGFGNNGKCWQLYSGMHANNIASIKVTTWTTKIMIKVKVTSSTRNSLLIKTGYAIDPAATAPTATKSYASAFNKAGGAFPMAGSGGAASLTFGLDCSEFADKLTSGKGVIFLQISGTGTVNEMSVMVYTNGTSKETKYNKNDVAISGTMNLGVPIELISTQNANGISTRSSAAVTVRKIGAHYVISLPTKDVYAIMVTNMQGQTLETSETKKGSEKYVIGKNLAPGSYIITARSEKETFSKKVDIVN